MNQAFLHEFLPGVQDPTGRTLGFDTSKPDGGEPTYIEGVVGNILHDGVKTAAKPMIYLPFIESPYHFDPMIVVRGRMAAAALASTIAREVHSLDPEVALTEPRMLAGRVDDSIFVERLTATLSGFFGVLALMLAAIGIYGVMSYSVARRTSEIGLRIALGAAPGRIEMTVLRDGLSLIAAGIAIGVPLSLAAARVSASLLYGVKPNDPVAFGCTAAVLVAVGTLAAFVPARRAASVAPMEALRHD